MTKLRTNLFYVSAMLTGVSALLILAGQWELGVGVISHLAYPIKMLVDSNDGVERK